MVDDVFDVGLQRCQCIRGSGGTFKKCPPKFDRDVLSIREVGLVDPSFTTTSLLVYIVMHDM
jgi:hypothetical protein